MAMQWASREWLPLLLSIGSRCGGVSACSTWAQWSRHADLVAPQHVGSSRKGIEPMFPVLAGRFVSTGPAGKSLILTL